MRRDRIAETLLTLVGAADRAASAVGDLVEEGGARRQVWFWRSVLRLWLSWLGRDLAVAPLTLIVSGIASWFVYMMLALVLAVIGYVVVTLLWGTAYVLAHHTGLELLTDLLRLRVDWPPIPAWATFTIQAVALFAVAPFQVGRVSASVWRGREISHTLVVLIVWTALSMLVPIVGVGIAAYPSMVPVSVSVVLLGALYQRFRPTPARSG